MTTPTILLLGKNGQVGSALQRRLAGRAGVSAHDRTTCDLGNIDQLRDVIRRTQPHVVVNAAAYTAVDLAETEEEACHRINAIAPGVIAEEVKKIGACLIHYSTDYVFDGEKAAGYREDNPPRPLNAYGRSKLAGDQAILAAGGSHIILRVSWVYGLAGQNFAKTILRLAAERDELKIVADQFGAPTSAELIADVTSQAIDKVSGSEGASVDKDNRQFCGIFNLAPLGCISWHDYAMELIRESARQGRPLGIAEDKVIPIASTDYPVAAVRPKNSLLDTSKIRQVFSIDLPDWRTDVKRFVTELDALKS